MILRRLSLAALGLAAAGACAVNPATGEKQLMLVSEGSEINLGLAGAKDVRGSMAVLPDSGMQQYVRGIGLRMALASERPTLPWDFTVLDDPQVNAFALPGGPIFVTRGILAHFNSEAELASVLGHEIGHVTARHSAAQMSRTQLAQIGLAAGSIASEDFARVAGGVSAGLGLLFLKYGRGDETQADALGFRYAYRDGYDVRAMADVFTMLDRTSGGAGKVPAWASTHPAPADRAEKTRQRIDSLGADLSRTRVLRDEYLRRLDGMAYGADPRQGFFRGARFHHPDLAFRLDFPVGWQTENGAAAVTAVAPQGVAQFALSFAEGTPDAARQAFMGQGGLQVLRTGFLRTGAGSAPLVVFRIAADGRTVEGLAAFVAHGGRTFRLLGLTTAGRLGEQQPAFERAVLSFAPETDRTILGVQPSRVAIVTVPSAMSVEQFESRFPSTGGLARFLLVNNLQEGALLKRGQLVKRITGGQLPS